MEQSSARAGYCQADGTGHHPRSSGGIGITIVPARRHSNTQLPIARYP
ncbi:hypothetical protein [Chloroflexus sp.]|nr:hypothetical protein [uncultured Chloroflexus sp.]